MPIAALYDIHANLPALEAVLGDVREARADRVVIGGDVVPGPMPRETLKLLRDLDIPVQYIYGNGEVAVLEVMAGNIPGAVPEQFRPIIQWTAQQLGREDEKFLASWPKTLRAEISGLGNVLFCHATPRNENQCFTRRTPEQRLRPIFDEVEADVVVCGHTHMQFDRLIATTRVINAGSVGMPFGEAGANWLLLGPEIQFRHTAYDLEKAAQRLRTTDYPQVQDFITHSLMDPPSGEKMLELFARAELR